MKGHRKLCQKLVSKVTLHFVWGHLSRKQTVYWLSAYLESIDLVGVFFVFSGFLDGVDVSIPALADLTQNGELPAEWFHLMLIRGGLSVGRRQKLLVFYQRFFRGLGLLLLFF